MNENCIKFPDKERRLMQLGDKYETLEKLVKSYTAYLGDAYNKVLHLDISDVDKKVILSDLQQVDNHLEEIIKTYEGVTNGQED